MARDRDKKAYSDLNYVGRKTYTSTSPLEKSKDVESLGTEI